MLKKGKGFDLKIKHRRCDHIKYSENRYRHNIEYPRYINEVDLIVIPGQRFSGILSFQKSSCNKTFMVSRPVKGDTTNRTFVSGDELPCGFKLRTFELCQSCSCDCGGRVHNIELSIAEKDLQRWERAGRLIRSTLSPSPPDRTKVEGNGMRQHNVVSEDTNVAEYTRAEDVEFSVVGTARSASRKAPRATIKAVEGMMDFAPTALSGGTRHCLSRRTIAFKHSLVLSS